MRGFEMLAKISKGRNDLVPIGVVAQRTGLAVSAIRYYEERGLIASIRTGGNQRRFLRSDIRRLSFVLIAQRLGLGLAEIERELASLPQGRTPTVLDWQRISRSLRGERGNESKKRQRAKGCCTNHVGSPDRRSIRVDSP